MKYVGWVEERNSEEVRQLTGQSQLNAAAADLMEAGCPFVYITGTHEDTAMVINTLQGQVLPNRLYWQATLKPLIRRGGK